MDKSWGKLGLPLVYVPEPYTRILASSTHCKTKRLPALRDRHVHHIVRDCIKAVGAKTACIKPGSPWKNGYCESSIGRIIDELLNGEIFYSPREAQIIIESWRNHYNTKRPHSVLGYHPPAPEAIVPMIQRPIMH